MSHLTTRIAEGGLLADGSTRPTLSGILPTAPLDGERIIKKAGAWRAGTPSAESLALALHLKAHSPTTDMYYSATYNFFSLANRPNNREYNFYNGSIAQKTQSAAATFVANTASSRVSYQRAGSQWSCRFRIAEAGVWLITASLAMGQTSPTIAAGSTFRLTGTTQGAIGPTYFKSGGASSRGNLYICVFDTTGVESFYFEYGEIYSNPTVYEYNTVSAACLSFQITKLG